MPSPDIDPSGTGAPVVHVIRIPLGQQPPPVHNLTEAASSQVEARSGEFVPALDTDVDLGSLVDCEKVCEKIEGGELPTAFELARCGDHMSISCREALNDLIWDTIRKLPSKGNHARPPLWDVLSAGTAPSLPHVIDVRITIDHAGQVTDVDTGPQGPTG